MCEPQSYKISLVKWLFGCASVANLLSLVVRIDDFSDPPSRYSNGFLIFGHRSFQWYDFRYISSIFFKCKFSFIEHQIWGIWDIFLNFFHASWSIWYFVFYLCSMLLVLVSHQNFHLFKILSGILNKVDVCKLMAVVSFYCVMNFNFYCVMNSLYVRTGECNDEKYKIPLLVWNSAINHVGFNFPNIKRNIKKEHFSAGKGKQIGAACRANNRFTVHTSGKFMFREICIYPCKGHHVV